MIAIDTNLLVYAHRAGATEHKQARKAIERAASATSGWGISTPCIAEFWCVVTHPETPRKSSPTVARAFLDSLITEGGAQLWNPLPGSAERVLRLAVAMDVRGPRIFDLQIAAVAMANGATEIWTHDAGFVALPGLEVVDPLA